MSSLGPFSVPKKAILRAGPKKAVRNEPRISKMRPKIGENLEGSITDASTVKISDKFRLGCMFVLFNAL